jgi:exodeoxyribonuclease VII small subunit
MPQKKVTPEQQQFSLEDKLREIKEILQKMQLGGNDFDENIKLFTQGTALIAQCRGYLDTAEVSIKQLVEGPDGPESQDFH